MTFQRLVSNDLDRRSPGLLKQPAGDNCNQPLSAIVAACKHVNHACIPLLSDVAEISMLTPKPKQH